MSNTRKWAAELAGSFGNSPPYPALRSAGQKILALLDEVDALRRPWIVMWDGQPRSAHQTEAEANKACDRYLDDYHSKFKAITPPLHAVVQTEETP
jgi:hypothetical protein